jgi:serine/threonine protein kinase
MAKKLGRYEILGELGQGGFAVVYRARDRQLDRLVALKELRAGLLPDTTWVKRFRREARTIARLDHYRVVTIHDIYEMNGRLFIVMRLVDGPTLGNLIATRGALPWSEVREITTAIVEGLDYAHSQGILHRDLKPGNILMDPERGPMLSDFGLAKLIGESHRSMTADGGLVGTVHYIAPEVWEGQGTTPQSDIYALGCVLYEMLTGEKLFKGESPPTVMMSHFNPLSLPVVWPEGVPAGVSNILTTAVAGRPTSRYATPDEMARALRTLEKNERNRSHRVIKGLKKETKLCVCGRSKSLPLCDWSHEAEDWTCAANTTWAKIGFCASYRYENLALKLASHYQGVTCVAGEPLPALETSVIIVDGTDLDFPVEVNNQIRAKKRYVMTLGVDGALLNPLFPNSHIVDLAGLNIFQAFKRIRSILDENADHPQGNGPDQQDNQVGKRPSPAQATLKSAFVSHAVKDEALIMPVLDYLYRYFRADIFTCADSISPGTNWQAEITDALQGKENFVYLLSQSTLISHFCSFEIGMAYALKKPIILISLDGSPPPTFVQHLQTIDLNRLEQQKPWLEKRDILLDELLRVLS